MRMSRRACIGEGIETALPSQGRLPPDLGAQRQAPSKFPVLERHRMLDIFADHDAPGFAAAQKCGERWADGQREVFIQWPHKIGSDFADEMRP